MDYQGQLDVQVERAWQRLNQLREYGRTEARGVNRPVYSKAWLDARNQVAAWMREDGSVVTSDQVGNLFAASDGGSHGPVVLSGSHLDSVRNGGAYDGALGVIAAMAAANLLREEKEISPHLEVVAFAEEEGSRFEASSYWSSRAITGGISLGELDSLVDTKGVSIREAMLAIGLDPTSVLDAGRDDLYGYIELHIEQGRYLEQGGIDIGVVTAIVAQRRFTVTIIGRADHAGTTPAELRADALVGAAEVILDIERTMKAKEGVRATVGRLEVLPGTSNVIPGQVEFTIDIRSDDEEKLAVAADSVIEKVSEVADARSLSSSVKLEENQESTPLSEMVQNCVSDAARDAGKSCQRLPSGAGHDAQVLAGHMEAGMIFIPCVNGVSHHPDEAITKKALSDGIDVLARSLRQIVASIPAEDRQ